MADASPTLCSCCQRLPPLAGAPFCAACLLTQGEVGSLHAPTGEHYRHLPPGTAVGPYRIAELLGEGGFAEVYSAAPEGGQPIALKIIKRGMDSREILARFRAEQRTIQGLSHPHIVEPLESGFTAEGLPWFAMAQIDGLPVTDYCEVAGLSLAVRLRLFLPICDAVQHAHQKGILHRDLKPSNLLVEETADGPVPKVIDFGIAKALEPGGSGHTHVTQLGHVVGTPAYMSPEQAAGNDGADTRSDIYSLGAVLYEMLAGGPPFDTDTLGRVPPGEWSRYLRENSPAPLSARLQGTHLLDGKTLGARGDLDQIVRKAMAPEPEGRYASVDAFAEDVRHWLEDRPVSARPPSLGELTGRYLRRHRWPVAVGVAALAGIVGVGITGTVLAIRARKAEAGALREKDRALAAERKADDARERSEHQSYQAAIDLAAIHLSRGEPYLAAERLRATPGRLRGWEWGYLMAAVTAPEASAESGLANPGVVAATPGGEIAAVAAGSNLRVVDVRRNVIIGRQRFPGAITDLALSTDGGRLATVESSPGGYTLHVSRIDGGEAWSTPLVGLADIAWEPGSGGALLMVSGNGPTPMPGRLARFDPVTGRVLIERVITRFKVHPQSLAMGTTGRMAVAENSYKDLEIFALPGLEILSTDHDSNGDGADAFLLDDVRDELIVARGAHVTAGPASHSAAKLVGDLTLPPTPGVAPVPAKSASVRHLNWLPDGRWLAAGDDLLLVQDGTVQHRPADGAAAVTPIAGGLLLAALSSGRLEIRPEILPPTADSGADFFLGGDRSEGRGAVFTPDSQHAVFQPWRRNTLESAPLARVTSTAVPYPSAAFPSQPAAEWCVLPVAGPEGTILATDGDHLTAVRQAGDDFEKTPVPHTDQAWSAEASADGRQLAVGVLAGVRLLDWKTGAILREWTLPSGPFWVTILDRGPSSARAIVAISKDSTLHYLPVRGAPVALPMPFRVNGFRPAPLAFHPGGALLAGALTSGGFAVYDLRTLPAAPRLIQRADSAPIVTALAFTALGRRLAVATDDHRLTLWDWEQALPLLHFPLNSTCASIAFSADGKWMANTDYSPSLVLRRAVPRDLSQ